MAVGEVHRFVVGDPRVQLIDVLAGSLMDSLAAAEQQSQPGDVVLDAGAMASLGDRVALKETRPGELGDVGVVDSLVEASFPSDTPPRWPQLPEETARQWLLPPVWERMMAGRGEFLADLRPAVPVFVRFGGLDFQGDPEAAEVLDAFVTRAEQVLDEQGGYVLQLTIGDKGAYLYAVFGSPIAHEDDAARACEGALRLLEIAEEVPVTDVQVGVATGRLRSGTYGHRERRTFCCLGDAVNLAARLMTRAPAGGIWVHGDVADAADERFVWEDLPPITVKGRQQEVPVRRLLDRAARRRPGASVAAALNAMVGREQELERLRELWRSPSPARARSWWCRPRPALASPDWSAASSRSSSPTACRSRPGRRPRSRPRRRTPGGAACGPTSSASTSWQGQATSVKPSSASTHAWSDGPRCSVRCSD